MEKKALMPQLKPEIIFVDLFDRKGEVRFIQERDFIKNCHKVLAKNGVVIFNLWKFPISVFDNVVNRSKAIFSDVFVFPLAKNSNQVIVSSKIPIPEACKNIKD